MRLYTPFSFIGFLAVCGLTAPAVFSAPVQYMVTVNTTSVAATYGYIDFQLNPTPIAPGSQQAMAAITNFLTDGMLNPADTNNGSIGEASPSDTLPAEVDLINSETDNEYTEGMTFGTTITFDLALSGPALTTPNGEGGGSFYLTFFDTNGNNILTTNPVGDALEIDINGDGSTTVSYQSPDVTLSSPPAIPEPASFALLSGGLLAIGMSCRRRRFAKRAI